MTLLNVDRFFDRSTEIVRLSYGAEQVNTYLLLSEGHAVVIDVCSRQVVDELLDRKLVPDYVILTHEHVDHLWGLNALRSAFPDVSVVAQEQCSAAIGDPRMNKAKQYRIYAVLRFGEAYQNEEADDKKYRCESAQTTFSDEYAFRWREFDFRLVHTPGHSPGSSMVFLNDTVFSGDTMLNEDTFLKFDGGDSEAFRQKTLPVITDIGPEMMIFPGHGEAFRKKDWKW